MKFIFSLLTMIVLIFILSALPDSFQNDNGDISFTPKTGWESIKVYFSGVPSGDSFHYLEGKDRIRSYFDDIGKFFAMSYLYLLFSSIFIIVISLIVAVWQAGSKKEWMKDIIGFFGFLPDFIFILFLQMGVVFLYKATGVSIAKVASRSFAEPAILLPILTLTIIPSMYLTRTLTERTYDVLTEDYILVAKSKGIKRSGIFTQHVIRNVIPYLKADLHKMLAIVMGNLFIVEFLFNIRGVTSLVFSESIYQFNLTVNGLLTFVVLYFVLYWSIRVFVYGVERMFAYG